MFKPEKHINANAINPTVMNVIPIPCKGLGTSLYSIFSLIPAKATIACIQFFLAEVVSIGFEALEQFLVRLTFIRDGFCIMEIVRQPQLFSLSGLTAIEPIEEFLYVFLCLFHSPSPFILFKSASRALLIIPRTEDSDVPIIFAMSPYDMFSTFLILSMARCLSVSAAMPCFNFCLLSRSSSITCGLSCIAITSAVSIGTDGLLPLNIFSDTFLHTTVDMFLIFVASAIRFLNSHNFTRVS